MDIDWCLTCNRRVDASNLYCSLDCEYGPGPSTTTHTQPLTSSSQELYPSSDNHWDELRQFEEEGYDDDACCDDDYDLQLSRNIEAVSKTNWAGRGPAGIREWAAEIPIGAHPDLPYSFNTITPTTSTTTNTSASSSSSSASSTSSDDAFSITSASSASSTHRAPNLVRPSRPLPPSLTMSKPEPPSVTPPRPILSIQKRLAVLSNSHSPGSTRTTSILSEDSLPTPASFSPIPFSKFPKRTFPSISDARAYELAACTKPKFSRNVPPRIISSSQSSLGDDFVSSPHWWPTNSMVAQNATRPAAKNPIYSSAARKGIWMASEAVRGRRSSRVAA